MAITGGMAYIVLFAVFQSIWLVTNSHQETGLTGTIKVSGSEQKIKMIPLNQPTEEASPEEWIDALECSNGFSVVKMEEPLRTEIDSFKSVEKPEFRNKFAEAIQKAFYEDFRDKHPEWIVIPMGIQRLDTQYFYIQTPHIDFLHDANIVTLLEEYDHFSNDFLEFLGKNEKVKSAALSHYNGNVEQYAKEMLSLDHLINIWIPLEPVEGWPLALTPAHQCDQSRTKIFLDGTFHKIQLLLNSESAVNDWYTRWNMQPDEVYVWDSRTVAHTAVEIGDGRGRRSAVACRLLIVHPKEDLSTSTSSPPEFDTLCHTEELFARITSLLGGRNHAIKLLTEMGYGRPCTDPSTAPSPSPSNVEVHVNNKPGILSDLRKLLRMCCC